MDIILNKNTRLTLIYMICVSRYWLQEDSERERDYNKHDIPYYIYYYTLTDGDITTHVKWKYETFHTLIYTQHIIFTSH